VREARLAPELVRRGRHCRWWRGRATSRRRRSGRRAAVEEVDWWDERNAETATARQAGDHCDSVSRLCLPEWTELGWVCFRARLSRPIYWPNLLL
jgi:hypothetical protein